MARSQILKDLASGNDIESVLFRLKVILADLENESINKWIDNEIEGYDDKEELPPYRIIEGRAMGSYIIGSLNNGIQRTNAPIPLMHLSEDIRKKLLTGHIVNGVTALKNILENKSSLGVPVEPEYCRIFSRNGLLVISMTIEINTTYIESVLAKVKNKLLNIIMKLDKEFDDIDSLDIFSENTSKDLIEKTEQFIVNILFDNSISIGDNNKIKSSEIGHK